jgi:hypothetical protein
MAIWLEVISVLGEEPEELGSEFGLWYLVDLEKGGVGAVLEENANECRV